LAHLCVAFVLDTTNGLVEFLIAMTNIKSRISIPLLDFVCMIIKVSHYFAVFQIINFFIQRCIEMDHVKPSLVHNFFRIQSIGMIPLNQFKEVILHEQYKKCKNKIKTTWYILTYEAIFKYMYTVTFWNLLWNNFFLH
jgi:hypothetical protein